MKNADGQKESEGGERRQRTKFIVHEVQKQYLVLISLFNVMMNRLNGDHLHRLSIA